MTTSKRRVLFFGSLNQLSRGIAITVRSSTSGRNRRLSGRLESAAAFDVRDALGMDRDVARFAMSVPPAGSPGLVPHRFGASRLRRRILAACDDYLDGLYTSSSQ